MLKQEASETSQEKCQHGYGFFFFTHMDAVLTTQAVPSASSFEICVLGSCPFAEAMSKHFICRCSREEGGFPGDSTWGLVVLLGKELRG